MSSFAGENFFVDNWKYLLAALAMHVAIAVMLTVSLRSRPQVIVPQLAIKGVLVDHTAQRLKREKAEAERQARERAAAEKQAQEAAAQQAAEEARHQEELRQQQAQAAAEQQRIAAAQKAAAQKASAQQAAAQKAAALKAAAEKQRLAEIAAKQEARRKAELAARAQQQREAELRRQLAEEEGRMEVQQSGLMNQYVAMIQQRVIQNWNKPVSARPGIQCDVRVTQAPGGTVLSVTIDKCNGDQPVRQSIEAAVYRSSPLPAPPDSRLFQRVIVFQFKPSD